MNNDLKTGVGFLFPASALIGFVISIINENYTLGILLIMAGILGWFIYMVVMESSPPLVTGNVIVLFGFLLSAAVFLKYGWDKDLFGGFLLKADGGIFALVLLFFSTLIGIVYRRSAQDKLMKPELTDSELALVKDAMGQDVSGSAVDPKIIVIKQEIEKPAGEAEEIKEPEDEYAYPPEYYYDYDEDDEYEYEDEEDEYEEDDE
ncbi:MAG: hypothetical protein V3S48_03405 [Candidatus Neomarinimicrobiota bacterium]